jgi:N-terminal acetyltransferase B complex non-catalytic subunit
LAILDATFSSKPQEVPEKREECLSEVDRTRSFFQKISEKDGKRDRSGPLALLELEHRAREHGVSQGVSIYRSFLDEAESN